jgi:hypothetical protein
MLTQDSQLEEYPANRPSTTRTTTNHCYTKQLGQYSREAGEVYPRPLAGEDTTSQSIPLY